MAERRAVRALVTWWSTLSPTVKKIALRIANDEPISRTKKLDNGQMVSEDLGMNFEGIPNPSSAEGRRKRLEQDLKYLNHRKRMEVGLLLKTGKLALRDVRRCRHKKCARLFLIPKSRPQKESCSLECGRNSRQSRFKSERRSRAIARVRKFWKAMRGRADRKEQTARRAGVTKNFITYAIRRGDVKL
jgi:hypothetical protein